MRGIECLVEGIGLWSYFEFLEKNVIGSLFFLLGLGDNFYFVGVRICEDS